jgi:hypothetical protein
MERKMERKTERKTERRAIIEVILIAAVVVSMWGAAGTTAPTEKSLPDFMSYRPDRVTIESQYGDCEAIVLCDSMFVTLHTSGLTTIRRHRAVLLITDNSIRRYGDPRILFDSERQEIRVTTARVFMRDGKFVETEENGFNIVTPFSLERAPDYQDWQEMVVTHVGIEDFCVAELEYQLVERERMLPWLSGVEFFGGPDPVLHQFLSVKVPPGITLKHASFNGVCTPEKSASGALNWSMKDLEGIYARHGGVWRGDYLPTVVFSTAESWDEICEYFDTSLSAAAHKSDSLEIAVSELSEQACTVEDELLEIHDYAFELVRGIDQPFHPLYASVRSANEIYTSAYAHGLDRAVVTLALLRRNGYGAVPVFLSAGRNCPVDVPAPEIIDRVLLEIEYQGGSTGDVVSLTDEEGDYFGGRGRSSGGEEGENKRPVYGSQRKGGDVLLLDPSSDSAVVPPAVMAGRTVARCGLNETLVHFPEMNCQQNISLVNIQMEIGEERISGSGSAVLTGIFSPYWKIRGMDKGPQKYLERYCGGLLGGAKLEDWNVKVLESDRVEFGFDFETDLPEKSSEGRIYLSLPDPPGGGLCGSDEIELTRSEYSVPLEVVPSVQRVEWDISGLKGWELVRSTFKRSEDNAVGEAFNYLSRTDGGPLTWERQLVVKRSVILPENYGHIRALLFCFGEDRLVLEGVRDSIE